MTVDEQKLELDRERLLVEQARLRIERRKVAIETVRFQRENRFFARNSATIIASSVTLLSVVVSGVSVYNTIKANERNASSIAERALRADQQSDRQWKIDAANFIATNKETLMSQKLAGKYPLRAITLLSFPSDITESLYDGLAAQARDPAIAQFWRSGQRLIEARKLDEGNIPQTATLITNTGQVVLPTNAATLSAQLNGPARRTVSNGLVMQYARDPSGTMALVVAAIVPPGQPATYRDNLYILVTLARIKGGWSGTESQRAAVAAIVNSSEHSDPTYKKWVDQARAAEISP